MIRSPLISNLIRYAECFIIPVFARFGQRITQRPRCRPAVKIKKKALGATELMPRNDQYSLQEGKMPESMADVA